VAVEHDVEAVQAHVSQRDVEITCDLGLGAGRATILTNDLTHAYVDENMGTS
jgi:glutamate N-acetyltransferase/amino-acid N-acetyltransferase